MVVVIETDRQRDRESLDPGWWWLVMDDNSYLNICLWSLFQPSFDLFQIVDTVHAALQIRMLLQQVHFHHIGEIVQNAGKVYVSPSQLKNFGFRKENDAMKSQPPMHQLMFCTYSAKS